ncbi:MAG: DUF3667 domain-containing protein [Prevotella sp.]|nr:DUF3667 domain-containing protein [Prevotella sp.]
MNLRERYNRFKEWQRNPFKRGGTPAYKGIVHHCCNCDMDFEGNFCPNCGQRAVLGPIGWKSVATGILLLWGMDSRSLSYTLLQLIFRPGYLISDYINGRRQISFPPVKMLFILTVFYAVFKYLLGNPADWFVDVDRKMHVIGWLKGWTEQNLGWAMLLAANMLILPTWITFRYSPKNTFHSLPQGFFIQVFLASLSMVVNIFSDYFLPILAWANVFLYLIAYKQLFGYGWWGTIWRFITMYLFAFMLLCVCLIIGEIFITGAPATDTGLSIPAVIIGIIILYILVMIPLVMIIRAINKHGYKLKVKSEE